jgi:pyrroline-5-carboxylate reductase
MGYGRLGFIGGGNMAAALVRGILGAGLYGAADVFVFDVKAERRAVLAAEYGVQIVEGSAALVAACDVIFLSVKPQVMDTVLDAVGPLLRDGQLLISVAAGVPLRAMEGRLPTGTRVIRSMPNTPATVLAGATAIAAGTFANASDMKHAEALFAAVGKVVTLDEVQLDAVTGLSGSGPAYLMLIIEALADGGVKVGLHRDTALLLAAQTVYGSAKLLLETGEHPGRLKDMVTSPGGTAIAGLHTLESGALRKTLMDAVEVASKRSEELGEQMARKMALK